MCKTSTKNANLKCLLFFLEFNFLVQHFTLQQAEKKGTYEQVKHSCNDTKQD